MKTIVLSLSIGIVMASTSYAVNAQGNKVAQPAALLKNTRLSPELIYENEKEAIKKVISNETETYYRQDFEGWKSNFVETSYFRQYGYWEGFDEKVRYYNGFDTLRNIKEAQFKENRTIWKGSYETRTNENFRIYDNVAWYTFEQDSYEGKTNKFLGRSIETRILEKHKGQWKIAYLGYHYLPLPKEENK